MKTASYSRVIVLRLKGGSDLLEELTALAEEQKIKLAEVSGIGALSRAELGVFLPGKNTYRTNVFQGELEICSLQGNVSLKEGRPFVHAHLVLSDRRGRAYGGHLLPGCRVFVAEVMIKVMSGVELKRIPDEAYGGLSLWPIGSSWGRSARPSSSARGKR